MRYLSFLAVLLLLASCQKQKELIVQWEGNTVHMIPKNKPGYDFGVDPLGNVTIECILPKGEQAVIRLKGQTKCGSFAYKGNHPTTIILDNLELTSQDKTPLSFKNAKRTVLYLPKGSVSKIYDAPEASELKGSDDCLKSRGDLTIDGDGILYLRSTHKGSKGMKLSHNFEMLSGTLDVATSGMYLTRTQRADNGPMPQPLQELFEGAEFEPGDEFPPMPPADREGEEHRPPMPPRGTQDDSIPFMPRKVIFDGNRDSILAQLPEPGQMIRYKYSGTTKGIKIMGQALIAGGVIRIKTQTPGAEGFEAKQGITILDGQLHVEAYDDAINTNGQMIVEGGDIYAKSTHNDGIDINYGLPGAYIQHGGKVEAITEAGPPEEALDTDWTEIEKDGGELIRHENEHFKYHFENDSIAQNVH